jgi:hypothetical protein
MPGRLYLGDGKGVFKRSAPDALPAETVAHAGRPSFGDLNGD